MTAIDTRLIGESLHRLAKLALDTGEVERIDRVVPVVAALRDPRQAFLVVWDREARAVGTSAAVEELELSYRLTGALAVRQQRGELAGEDIEQAV